MNEAAERLELFYRDLLVDSFNSSVPARVRDWAASVPGLGAPRASKSRETGQVSSTEGLLIARILGMIGNPRVAVPLQLVTIDGKRVVLPDGEPYARTLRQLWAYCGVGDPARKPQKGMTQTEMLALGKTGVQPLLYTFAVSLQKSAGRSEKIANSELYKLLLSAKAEAQTRVHKEQCQNHKRPGFGTDGCGTQANPEWGAPGSPWRGACLQ